MGWVRARVGSPETAHKPRVASHSFTADVEKMEAGTALPQGRDHVREREGQGACLKGKNRGLCAPATKVATSPKKGTGCQTVSHTQRKPHPKRWRTAQPEPTAPIHTECALRSDING